MYDEAEYQAIAVDTIALIEDDFLKRIEDLVKLKRIMDIQSETSIPQEKEVCARSLIVMLYAYYEGYIKYSSLQYVSLIDGLDLRTSDVKSTFAAAALNNEFLDIEIGEKKSDIFRNSLPDDSKLHKLSRRSILVEKLHNLWDQKVTLGDSYIKTDSNLTFDILKRTLYLLCLNVDAMNEHRGSIHKLLNYRNTVAHEGITTSIPKICEDYPKIEESTIKIIRSYKELLTHAILQKTFLRAS